MTLAAFPRTRARKSVLTPATTTFNLRLVFNAVVATHATVGIGLQREHPRRLVLCPPAPADRIFAAGTTESLD